jgi:hypothetical protein
MVNWRSAYSKARLSCTYVVVDDLGERSQTVGGARGVGDDLVLGLVGIKVNTTDEPGRQAKYRLVQNIAYMGASAEGAEMMTFLAPPFK